MHPRLGRLILLIAGALAFPVFGGDALRLEISHTEPWGYYPAAEKGTDTRNIPAKGIAAEIAVALARESGLKIESTLAPPPRIWRDLKNGDTDLSFVLRADDRESEVINIAYLFPMDTVIYARPGTTLNAYHDLARLRIGYLRDVPLNNRFDNDGNLQKVEFRDYEAMVDTLLAGRLDAIAGNRISLNYLLEKRGHNAANWPHLLLQRSQLWAQMSKRSAYQNESQRLREAIDRLRSQGFFEAVVNRYASQ